MEKPEINKRLETLIETTVGGNVTEFARRCKIPHSQTLSNMLNANNKGKYSQPSAPTLALIAENMPNVDLYWLLTGKEKPPDQLSEPDASYGKQIALADYLSLSKRIDVVIQQNTEILEKLTRNMVKDILKEEKESLKKKSKNG